MENEQQITEDITIAGQPTVEELQELGAQGFRTVVNLRVPGEPGEVEDEERVVEGSGLSYSAIPVTPEMLDDAAVERFSQALDSTDSKPALVHCRGGGRAGAMVLLHIAIENGWSIEEAVEEGHKWGISPSSNSPYREFFESYLKRHSAGERR